MKKAFPWFGIILYLADVVLDFVVGVGYIQDCHYNYGISVLAFFWLPGLLLGGLLSINYCDEGCCGKCGVAALFILGTLLGPIILIPGTLYLLVKAAINPSSQDDNKLAKV